MRLVLALLVIATLRAPALSPASGRDDAAIREVVAQYLGTREHRDAQALGALFTDDADQLTSSGEWRKGRDEIVRGTLASSDRTGGTRTITIQTVRFVGTDAAIADGRYELAGAQGRRSMWTSFVLARDGRRWRIAAIRNMLPAPPAAPAK